MLWEVEITPNDDVEGRKASEEIAPLLGVAPHLGPQGLTPALPIIHCSRIYLLDGELTERQTGRVAVDLLLDQVVERCAIDTHKRPKDFKRRWINVFLKPGVMDPVAESVQKAIADLGLPVPRVRTGKRFRLTERVGEGWHDQDIQKIAERLWANDAIEEVILGAPPASAWGAAGTPYHFRLITLPILDLDDAGLMKLSKEGQLYLSLAEMQTIRAHFRALGRDATDAELETIAQTWSEHCSHKTLKGKIEYTGPDGPVFYDNLLKQTIFGATMEIRQRLGEKDWCVSVFEDNAGIVQFDDQNHVCFKVETHNHPSAIEPYGGANTGLGGVIRDVLGTGLGGQPVCNTDVFCFAPPHTQATLPPSVLHPKRVMRGVVSGVRDYGNRMGIPTINGAICFDERYLGNPLVYCGTVGLIPVGKEHKEPRPGDLIVAVGGRTGRDGIHGATFSSAELTHESEKISGGAVQIGNAITEKKLLDVLLVARDRGLFTAITDCGAGGFSSAVGEMGAEIGAEVHLERAPLKYDGLSYTEIWISEAQERMVTAVPPEEWPALRDLCASEDVEATVLGEYKPTGRLRLLYHGQQVADLDMHFLHDGRPPVVRKATWRAPFHGNDQSRDREGAVHESPRARSLAHAHGSENHNQALLAILSSLNVCSKEWVIRQYDHEVQGGSVIKPLVGVKNDGPSDAAVVTPVLGSTRGIAIGCGINPRYGDLDPYWMAASAIDEAVRNVVAVGADPKRIAILDNFCWGNTDRPETLGSLVRAAEACRDIALAYGTPFISGKDSLNNEFHAGDVHISIPPTLLISALGIVPDVCKCVTMDLKKAGNLLYLLGENFGEMGGSHFNLVKGLSGGIVPQLPLSPDRQMVPWIYHKLHEAMQRGLVQACHDLSEGGLAVALAEMAFAGGWGGRVSSALGWRFTSKGEPLSQEQLLFAESNSRFLIEVAPEHARELESLFDDGYPCAEIGAVTAEPILQILDAEDGPIISVPLAELKEAWQRPLRW